MTSTVQYPVRFARSSAETILKLHEASAKDPFNLDLRNALADEIEQMGDEGYHNILKTLHPTWQGVWNGRDNYGPPSASEEASILREHIPDRRHTRRSVYEPWTHTAQESKNFAEWDTNFNKGYSIIPSSEGGYSIFHHPEEFYEADEDDQSPWELPGLDDDNFDDRYNYSRIRYAQERRPRMSPEEVESKFLEAIAKNPENQDLHQAYADHLDEQGRHGEALFRRIIGNPDRESDDILYEPHREKVTIGQVMNPPTGTRIYDPVNGFRMDDDPRRVLIMHYGDKRRSYWTTPEKAVEVMKHLKAAGVPLQKRAVSSDPRHPDYIGDRGTYHQIVDAYDPQHMAGAGDEEEPIRNSAYRAPKGGAVVRGTYYQGGKLIPDLEGDFANPPVPEQPMVQYPQPKQSLRDRLKAKFKRSDPLVVSYARATPESLSKLIQAAHRGVQMSNPNPDIHAALAEELSQAGRHKEAELVNSGRFQVDLNGGGRIVAHRPPRIPAVTRQTRGIPYDQLYDQIGRRIGNNRTVVGGPNGDVHVLLHGNHVVTAHPDGSYSLFTRGYPTRTTFQTHQQITGHAPNVVRGQVRFMEQPFQEGMRFREAPGLGLESVG